jgi:hypothetical protein
MGSLKVLNGTLMFFGGLARPERAQIAAFSRFGIDLPRVEAVFAAL